ncbi:Major cardiolipin synthase ClsA [Symmachiella macrocystis]|uniref:Cardiolipin synthase n=1 Tax=Symmachiella macrocystis TaxID=2527985 RepID=A0A5C6BKM1_9PLAN|nr:cardiolipin synthase [Symmachiella macrocystis]TWU11749.1 Major cardiolipin synthase ClsA [Symmachiella macrocystis]
MNENQEKPNPQVLPSKPRFQRLKSIRQWYVRWRIYFVVVMHILGALSSIQAIMSTRTPQGATAWAISLNTCPYLAVPAYWVFGRSQFDGYDHLRHSKIAADSKTAQNAIRELSEKGMLFTPMTELERSQQRLLESIAEMPTTRYNDADLLINGEATFAAIFDRIASAEDYILIEFYIMRSDELGNKLKDALIAKAKEGVRVYVLYDGLGSKDLPNKYLQSLNDAGVKTAGFKTTKGWGNFTRVNFRNHRKIVLVDGKEAFVGGHNVGDEYVGKHPTLTPWRDTHVAIRGPVVLEAQVTFVEDWRYATGETLQLTWVPERAPKGDVRALCLPTGPADPFETGTLLLLDLINTARDRIWIASPYFVPDTQFVSALQLAALRGVDVRVLFPENNDDWLVDLTSYSYLDELGKVGVKFYRYEPGFMHQKVLLIDEGLSAIGTANFDNRSMRLNFEVTILLHDTDVASKVQAMLEADLKKSRQVAAKEFTQSSAPFRFLVKTARLLAPVQ